MTERMNEVLLEEAAGTGGDSRGKGRWAGKPGDTGERLGGRQVSSWSPMEMCCSLFSPSDLAVLRRLLAAAGTFWGSFSRGDTAPVQQQWSGNRRGQMCSLPQKQLNKLDKLPGFFSAQLTVSSSDPHKLQQGNALPPDAPVPGRHVAEPLRAGGQDPWLCLLLG